jgi:energy-coupling factor transporter ATP-binding protein EcfA2
MNNANTASNIYALGINQTAQLINTIGHNTTVLVQGDMGTGKSSILKILAGLRPTHQPVYFDGTTKVDSADMFMVKYSEDGLTFKTVPLDELGLHLPEQPIILMLDELGKCNRSVMLACNRLMLERKHSGYELHPDSLLFATTNKGTEGVGDLLPAHTRNRITVVTMRKPDNMEFIEWGIDNGIDPILLGFCKEHPELFHSFEQYENPDENPHIFHPRSARAAFWTPRSGEKSSDILKLRHVLDDTQLTAALIGTIGDRTALDLAAFISLADKLPTRDQIENDPMNAPVPDSPAAVCMVVYRALATIERKWVDPWLTYMNRLSKEAQGLFVNGVRATNYSRRDYVVQNKKFQDWCMANNYMFSADK